MNKYQAIIGFLGLFQVTLCHANTDERLEHFLSLSLEELMTQEISISTNTRQTLTKAPGVVSIITADDIKATGATNLVDVLEGVPGIHIRASSFGFRPLIQFRGANATQTLLMVNGAPLRDLMWGFGIFWKGLPVSMIERVEIIRGPGSALFGSDASAGVINVITRTAIGIDDAEFGVRAGSFNTKTGWLQQGANWGGYDVGMTAEFSSTDGHDPFIEADMQTEVDPAISYAPGTAGFGWRNQDIRFSVARGDWRLLADYMQHSDLEIGMVGAGVLDPVTEAGDSRYNIDLLYNNENFADNWGLDADLRYQHLDYTSGDGFQERPPGYDDGTLYPNGVINQIRSAERRYIFGLSGLYSGIVNHALRVGAGVTLQDLYYVEHHITDPANPTQLIDVSDSPGAFAPENARTIRHLYVQDIWAISDSLELTAGVRYDDYSDFGDALNPRLALVWNTSDRLTTKLMYGEAFRAPSYLELYSGTTYTQPNANLNPETSQTIDLAFGYTATNDLQLNLNLFHFTQRDLIKRAGLYENTGDHTIRGVEVEALWQAARNLKVSGNLTLRSQEDSGYRAVDEADREAYLRMDWGLQPDLNWDLQANWVGKRPRSATDSRPDAEAYLLTDTTMRYAGSDNWEFAASVRNLFDVDARASASIANDLPLPERNFYAEIRYKFLNGSHQ